MWQHFSLHGWYFFGSTKKPDGKGLSMDQIFWLIVIVLSMSAAVFVMGTNIQGIFSFLSGFLAFCLSSVLNKAMLRFNIFNLSRVTFAFKKD
jgi:hypothetical protein